MNIWQKLKLGWKFVFGSFETGTDYLLKLGNEYLSKPNIADKIEKLKKYLSTVVFWLEKFAPYCPSKWADEYQKIMTLFKSLLECLNDNKVTREEIVKTIEQIKAAYVEWNN